MRRSEKEIKNREDIIDVLNRCDVIRIGLNTPDHPYVLPMNFGFETDGDSLTIWMHCAAEGRKITLIEQNPRIGFEADCSHILIADETACGFAMNYESVIGYGNICICNDGDSKVRGLKAIMRQYAPGKEFSFPESELTPVRILRLDVEGITGKRS